MDSLASADMWGTPVGLGLFFFFIGIGMGAFFWGVSKLAPKKGTASTSERGRVPSTDPR